MEYRDNGRVQVPSNKKSRDSREFGPVSMGLITARVDCVLWPFSRFGPVPPRPNFDLAKALSRRRAKERNESHWSNLMTKRAHPEDSTISPYSDWEWTSDTSYKGNEKKSRVGEEGVPRKPRRSKRDDDKETIWRDRWNQMSRGGQLGRDAGREEDPHNVPLQFKLSSKHGVFLL